MNLDRLLVSLAPVAGQIVGELVEKTILSLLDTSPEVIEGEIVEEPPPRKKKRKRRKVLPGGKHGCP